MITVVHLALGLLLAADPLQAPDSLVAPMRADTTVEIEAVIYPPANALLPLYYQVAWGDGETLAWTGPLRSATDISRYHRYRFPGEYAVSVRARDSLGRTSPWREPLAVRVEAAPIQKGVFATEDPIVASPALDLHGNIYFGDESGKFYSLTPDARLRWTFQAQSAVYAAAAIDRDLVYVGSLDSNLYGLDTTGKKRWSLYLGDEVYSAAALGVDGSIYVGTDKGLLVAVAPNGKKKWSFKTGDEIAGSPTVSQKGLIYVTADSVYCLGPKGKRRWAYGAPEGDYFYASAVVDDQDLVYVGNTDGHLYCLGPDGRQQWRAPVPEEDEIRSEVTIGPDGSLYFGTDGYYFCRAQPQSKPTVLYEALDIIIATAALSDQGTTYVLADDGMLYALAESGRLLWSREVASGDKDVYYSSSPTIGPDGTVYVGSWDGGLYAFRGDGPPAHTLWPQYRGNAQHTGRVSSPKPLRTR